MEGVSATQPSELPRSPLGWLPYLWSRVLFAGPTPAVEPWRWTSLALLMLVPGALLYPSLGFRLLEPDESRYAQIPFEMLLRNDWLVPRLQGEPYLDKPPLFYWLVAWSYRLFGVHDWAARLVPALAVHATILATYFFGRRLVSERAALCGALALTLAPGLISMGRMLLLDGLLTLWATLALFAAFEAIRDDRFRPGWWLLAAVATALGVLTKGPVALVLLAPPLWLWRRLSGQGMAVSPRALLGFLAVVAVICLPWYIALAWAIPGFLRYFFWEHHVLRYMSNFAHAHGVWFYVPVLLFGLLPASLWLLPFGRFLVSGDEAKVRERPASLGFLLLAGGWCLFFFTLSTGKLPTYILPAFPPLALALGHFLTRGCARGVGRIPRGFAVAGSGSFALLLFVHHVGLPWYAAYRSPMNHADAATRLCGDKSQVVICYPRSCDSLAFYLGRADMRNFRSRDIEKLRAFVRRHPRTVIVCTHRHSLQGLKQLLPPEIRVVEEAHFGLRDIPGVPPGLMTSLRRLMGETALGLCDAAVVEAPVQISRAD